jgi:hypothetical protein
LPKQAFVVVHCPWVHQVSTVDAEVEQSMMVQDLGLTAFLATQVWTALT